MTRALLISALVVVAAARSSAQDFNGYPCTVDCSGHEAGYEWADRKGIDSIDDCGGSSNSFIEGCQAYVEEQQRSDRADSDNDEAVQDADE